MSTVSSKEPTARLLIARWTAHRAGDYCQLKNDLYQVRNPGFNGSPALSFWPRHLVDPDREIMASIEHYFLARCWVGSGQYSAVQVKGMCMLYTSENASV
jgi:hypothetical protein